MAPAAVPVNTVALDTAIHTLKGYVAPEVPLTHVIIHVIPILAVEGALTIRHNAISMNCTVRVYHEYYGCDTGCCGHRIELEIDGTTAISKFHFSHPYGEKDHKKWATELAKEEIQRKHPECIETINWDTIEVEVSDD